MIFVKGPRDQLAVYVSTAKIESDGFDSFSAVCLLSNPFLITGTRNY